MKISAAFDKTLEKFDISGKALALQSGVSEQMISGFRNDKQQIKTDSLEKLLLALTPEARNYFSFLLFESTPTFYLWQLESSANEIDLTQISQIMTFLSKIIANKSRESAEPTQTAGKI